jgi:3-dehydroquinate synthase
MSFTLSGKLINYDTSHTEFINIKSRSKNYTVNFRKNVPNVQTNDILVIDKNVFELYDVSSQFDKVIKVNAIEENKNMDCVLQIVDQLSHYNTKKSDIMHVYGGGITQDVAGMAASMYKRGLMWNYTPTTLLSMCDSCIGSKVNVNFKKSKNQLGTMYPPNEVNIDTKYLQTLSTSDIDSGIGEILKLFSIAGIPWDVTNTSDSIRTCLNIKKAVIEEDEYENTIRPILNYGHTFGHVFETLSDFKIPHGIAVLLGMYAVDSYFGQDTSRYCVFAEKMKRYSRHIKRDESLFLSILQNDKKMNGEILNLIKVENGNSHMVKTVTDLNMVKKVYSYIDNL